MPHLMFSGEESTAILNRLPINDETMKKVINTYQAGLKMRRELMNNGKNDDADHLWNLTRTLEDVMITYKNINDERKRKKARKNSVSRACANCTNYQTHEGVQIFCSGCDGSSNFEAI